MKSKTEGWKGKEGIKWYSEGYIESRRIIIKHELKKEVLEVIDRFEFGFRAYINDHVNYSSEEIIEGLEHLKKEIEKL